MISEQTNGAPIYQGVYNVDSDSDSIKIYSWFAGLGLPRDRIDNLKKESQQQAVIASQKEKNSLIDWKNKCKSINTIEKLHSFIFINHVKYKTNQIQYILLLFSYL